MTVPDEFRLLTLSLRNYRCFPSVELAFHERLTVFVASNGGGKTAVLEGIATALRLFVDTLEGRSISKGFDGSDTRRVLSPANKMEPVTPTRLAAGARISGAQVAWARERRSEHDSRTTTVEAKELKAIATRLAKENVDWLERRRLSAPLFPLVAYYGTGRLWLPGRLTEGKRTTEADPNARIRGYTDCLSASSPYKYFIDWFRRFSYEENRETIGQESPHQPGRVLAAVRGAVDIAMKPSGWHRLEWDFAEDTIVAHHSIFGRLPVGMLSDGIRNMIGLVADIAHRAARLNPHLREHAAAQTPGIVLIDEVDMHLHPSWQQVVLQSLQMVFPNVQLIVTTHSPQVLTTVCKENIRILEGIENGDWSAGQPEHSPLAHESGDALAFIMRTPARPQLEVMEDVHAYEKLARVAQGTSTEALDIKRRLDATGFEFSEADKAIFDFLDRKSRTGEH